MFVNVSYYGLWRSKKKHFWLRHSAYDRCHILKLHPRMIINLFCCCCCTSCPRWCPFLSSTIIIVVIVVPYSVDSVRVVWSERSPPPRSQSSPKLFAHRRPVSIHAYPTTSINNRFVLSNHIIKLESYDISRSCFQFLGNVCLGLFLRLWLYCMC